MKIIDDLIELIMGDPKIRESKTLVNSFRVMQSPFCLQLLLQFRLFLPFS